MDQGCNGQVPSGVGGHAKPKKRPNSVIVERGYENGRSTTSSEYVCPCPLVQMIVYVVYIAAYITQDTSTSKYPNCCIYIIKIHVLKHNFMGYVTNFEWNQAHLAQAMSCITEPKRRNVQLKASPTAFQCGPKSPSSTSNHCIKTWI